MERSFRFLQGIFEEGVSYSMEEKREREEFEKEGLRLAQVLGILEAVPDAVEVGDVVLFVHVL